MPTRRVLIHKLPAPGASQQLSKDEARHLRQVLRLKAGDEVVALDAQGGMVVATLEWDNSVTYLVFKHDSKAITALLPLCLIVSVVKGEAMEWIVEKCVELGVARLLPLFAEHTVVRFGQKTPESFRQRWQRIADQALKQCGRTQQLEIGVPMKNIQTALSHDWVQSAAQSWFADEALADQTSAPLLSVTLEKVQSTDSLALFFGPEGGWSESERQALQNAKLQALALGPQVLRVETAVLLAVSMVAGRWQRF